MIDKKTIIRRLSLSAYFIAAFLTFLLLLFPFDRIKTTLEYEARRRTGFGLSVARLAPRFLDRFVMYDVVVSSEQGKVLFESPRVRTVVSLVGLIRGRLSLDLKASAYSGDISAKLQQWPGRRSVLIDANGLDVGSYRLFRDAGMKFTGKLGGNLELTGDAGKGRLWLKGLTSRELKIKGFAIPDLDFDQGWFDADIKGDRLTIRKLELDGKELKIRCQGDVVVREHGTMNLTIKLKPSERLAQEQAGLLSLLKNRDAEGFYELVLGGTLTEPMPRL